MSAVLTLIFDLALGLFVTLILLLIAAALGFHPFDIDIPDEDNNA